MAARLGGDEFGLSLLEDELSEVIREVEHIRRGVGEETAGSTLSVGICEGREIARASVASLSILEAAGGALADAKEKGPGALSIFRLS
jgi:GGDEF domain-containing protein